jgi:hypothetical protein
MALDLTYPDYDKVEELIQNSFYLLGENSELNYECMKNIFYNWDDKETVKRMGEQIDERGGFQALQANFYILCQVFRYLIHENPEREPELRRQFIIIRDKVDLYFDGVGDWVDKLIKSAKSK